MAKVLRIQHKDDGSGPWMSQHPEVRNVVDNTKIPQPLEDKGFDDKAISRLQDEKQSPTKFGFKDEAQMARTFTPEHLDKLKEHGYEPSWVDAKDAWSSDHQVFFTTHEGDEKHAKRQDDLKARTKFKEYSKEEIADMNKSLSKLQELLQKAKVITRKAGEKTGSTRNERRKADKLKEITDKLKDPKFRAQALQANTKEYVGAKIKQRDKDKAYDSAVETDDKNTEPVATKKRSGAFISQFDRRKNATDRKLINREDKGKLKKGETEETELEKGMDNSGLGGPGSVKAGAVKPSISKMPKPGNNSATPSIKIAQPTKKNPMKQAEQTQNKDIKDIKMKEAQAQMKPLVKFAKNGQWSLVKMESASTMSYDDSSDHVINGATVNQTDHRGADVNIANKQPSEVKKGDFKGRDYTKGGQDEANMAQRKAKNIEGTGIHAMPHVKKWGKQGASAVSDEVKKLKSKSKKNPVKEYNAEELAAYTASKKKEGE